MKQNKLTCAQVAPIIAKRQYGFTLLEIMVVVVIIGILAAYAVPKVFGNVYTAQKTKALNDVKTIAGALDMYKLDNFVYPSTEQGLQALVSKPAGQPEAPNWRKDGYLQGFPKDPWNNPYQYLNPGQHGEIDIYSLGKDGKPGGQDENADLGNWEAK